MNLLQMSFTGSIFIMLIFLLRLLAVNRLPKSTFLVLWGIAIIRLLIPFSIPSAFSVYSLFNRNAALQGALNDSPIARLLPLSNSTPSTVGSMATPQSMGAISFEHIIYFLGVALCLLIFATAYYCCMKKSRHSRPIRNSYISEWVKTHKIKRKIRFEQCDNISSPLTYGIFSPIILLPKNTDFDNCQELNYILLHEYLHIRRFDCLIKIVAVVTVCIHWFNPLVWLMYFFLNRDMELSCDEFVVRKNGKTARASYARLLIAMEERRSVPLAMFSEFSINVSEERITAIMKTKPFTVVSMVTASILILTLCAGFMTSAYGVKIDVGQPQTANVSVPNVDVPSINEKAVATAPEWVWPTTSNEISTVFGYQSSSGKMSDHINIKGEKGDEIFAAVDGQVIEIGVDREYGNYVVIESDNNIKIIYGHLEDVSITVNDPVKAGEKIGTIGRSGTATGYCLSFAVFANNVAVDPMSYYE